MTPALREAGMKGHGIHLSSSLSRTMESDTVLRMENPGTGEEKLKGDSIAQINCSVLGFPTPEPSLNTNFVNLKHFGSPQPSKHYQTVFLMSSNSSLNKCSENYKQKKLGDPNCNKLKNVLRNGTSIRLGRICSPNSEDFIKKEPLSETTSQSMADLPSVLDSDVTKVSSVENIMLPNCKWYQKNGLLDKASGAESKKSLLQCAQKKVWPGHTNVRISSLATEKEEEVNARLLHCVSKQKILLSQAKRTQKHLQMLLAKHVVKHCGQQMKFSMKHQSQRMRIFHEPARILDNSFHRCSEIKPEVCLSNSDSDLWKDTKNGFARCTIAEIQKFALSAAGLLSHVEEGLDSDATDSSSDEDLDEKLIRKSVPVNYSTEWKWLVDRARVGSRWTWLQAQISELEYKIQQLTDIHRQIRATKGTVVLEECQLPKDVLKKQIQLTDQGTLLNTTGNSQIPQERQDSLPEQDFEMSPSSPTLLLRNIEKQSAQLTEIINSLIAPLNLSPTSSPLTSKPCKHKRVANGISRSWLLNQKHIKKRRKDRTRLRSPSLTLMSTAARTRPLQSFHKRKLYRLSPACYWIPKAVPSKETQFHNATPMSCMISASTCNNCDHNAESEILKQHVPELDSSFHSVLSLPSDVPLHLHFETLLKKNEIKGDLAESTLLEDECILSSSTAHITQSTTLTPWRSGYFPVCKPQTRSETSTQILQGRKKRHLSETALGERNRFEEFTLQHTEPGSHNSFTTVTNINVISRSTQNSSQNSTRRRLRSESSYDINNIVIPMSLVAPAKLEKLQYKEILTPSWRIVDLQPLEEFHLGEEVEDLSDEVFSLRHKKHEEREQARWSLWEQSKWHRRNSRSQDVQPCCRTLTPRDVLACTRLNSHLSPQPRDLSLQRCRERYELSPSWVSLQSSQNTTGTQCQAVGVRSYGKYIEGQQGLDSLLKENHSDVSTVEHCASEAILEFPSEMHGLCIDASPFLNKDQEAKSAWWERRAFPLKDEEVAFLCQDETQQVERPSSAFPGEVFCSTVSDHSHPPKKQSGDRMEDYKPPGLGLSSLKKNR
ncbi:KAT8 regulatory NSL complex subunit 1-like protein isoform X2 [Vombatus ursinus]|uniref:KAT8 regulatory NSL complex subunit 1-like protein isoform X2 n=1 Tax=Vombatus ursinus TaxID=29139 RepID=UPI000FFD4D9E|nr:KAT8 regulatory NSL complex subunit 1-like protein isoform X2 [Vombatus ursinus]